VKVLVVILVVLAVLVCASIYLYCKIPLLENPGNFYAWLQTVTLFCTGVVVSIYTYLTHRMRKTADEQMKELRSTNEFDAYTRIHAQLSNEKSCRSRRHLFHPKFESRFASVAAAVLGNGFRISGNEIDCKHILENVSKDYNKLADFNSKLVCTDRHQDRTIERFDFCDSLEMVLLDFDIIAGPLYRGNKDVIEAAMIYKNVIEATAPAIRPFVAIQMALRGDNDYKKHYRFLLQYFDLLGELPKVEAPSKGDIH